MSSTDSLADLARPLLADAGLELWDIELGPSLVRIMVDRPDGVDLDALSVATAVISPLLDDRQDLVPPGRYDLEISSPGIERTLRTASQYRRYVGSLLAVKTLVSIGGGRRFRATLVAVTDDAVDLLMEGASEPVTVSLDQIERSRTVLEWGPQPKAGPKAGSKAGAKPGPKAGKQDKPGTKQSRSNRSKRPASTAGRSADDKDSAS